MWVLSPASHAHHVSCIERFPGCYSELSPKGQLVLTVLLRAASEHEAMALLADIPSKHFSRGFLNSARPFYKRADALIKIVNSEPLLPPKLKAKMIGLLYECSSLLRELIQQGDFSGTRKELTMGSKVFKRISGKKMLQVHLLNTAATNYMLSFFYDEAKKKRLLLKSLSNTDVAERIRLLTKQNERQAVIMSLRRFRAVPKNKHRGEWIRLQVNKVIENTPELTN